MAEPMTIRLNEVSKTFGTTLAVDRLSFEFSSGEIVGFVGPNGAGKTTTMRIMATLENPDQGDVTFDGISVLSFPEKVREKVGFVPDTLPSVSDLSVFEYLDFFAAAYGLRQPGRRAVMDDIIAFTGIEKLLDKTVSALSKGLKQRLSLARALVHDPAVLIMDEPAAGLDPRARIELRELLRSLADQGKAILISSHILNDLSEICHAAVILEQGKLLRTGTMEALMNDDAVCTLHRVKTLGDAQGLLRFLLEQPLVESARVANPHVEFTHAGTERDRAQLLRDLLDRGFEVTEFTQKTTGLEEVFMRVTKGEVQ